MMYEEWKWAVVYDDEVIEVFEDEESARAFVVASKDDGVEGYHAVLATIRWNA
jgi:hypothetical protein